VSRASCCAPRWGRLLTRGHAPARPLLLALRSRRALIRALAPGLCAHRVCVVRVRRWRPPYSPPPQSRLCRSAALSTCLRAPAAFSPPCLVRGASMSKAACPYVSGPMGALSSVRENVMACLHGWPKKRCFSRPHRHLASSPVRHSQDSHPNHYHHRHLHPNPTHTHRSMHHHHHHQPSLHL